MSAPIVWVLAVILAVAAATPPPSVQKTTSKLQLELTLTKAAYVVGEPVVVQLTARNAGDGPVRLRFTSGQRFDVVIRRRGGPLVWRWSHDKAFIQILSEVLLQPAETVGPFRVTWPQVDLQGRRVEAGEYEVVGVFLGQLPDGNGVLETPPLVFRIRE